MIEIDTRLLTEAFRDWQTAEHGAKTFMVRKWAEALGIAFQTLHRKFQDMGHMLPKKMEKCTKGTSNIAGLHDMARVIARMYAFIPKRVSRRPPLAYVIKKAIINGMLPPETANISVGTFARALRELNLLDHEGRVLRFEAKKPMEQVQYDVSGSEYLYVHRFEGAEPILKVRQDKGYKNRDKYENLRLWYHGLVDDHSRYWLAMPFASPGESSADAIIMLKWAILDKQDERIPFRGLFDRIYMDNGALARAEATKELMARIGVEIKTHEPESPGDTGKIEVKWKALWRDFEAGEFLMDPNWQTREYPLSEIKERLLNYTCELNEKKHPNMNISKVSAWKSIVHDGGVIDLDPGIFDTSFKRLSRGVERDGTFKLDNERYFVKGLYDACVWVYVGLSNGKIMVEDKLTHKRYEAEPFIMPGLDEHRVDKKLACASIREEAEEIKKEWKGREFKGVYQNGSGQGSVVSAQGKKEEGIISILSRPVKTKEVREVVDPFDVTVFASLQDAMKEVYEIAGYLRDGEREGVEAAIIENGLKKDFVVDLALDLRAALEDGRATG